MIKYIQIDVYRGIKVRVLHNNNNKIKYIRMSVCVNPSKFLMSEVMHLLSLGVGPCLPLGMTILKKTGLLFSAIGLNLKI